MAGLLLAGASALASTPPPPPTLGELINPFCDPSSGVDDPAAPRTDVRAVANLHAPHAPWWAPSSAFLAMLNGGGNMHTVPSAAEGGDLTDWASLGPGGRIAGTFSEPVPDRPGPDVMVHHRPDGSWFCLYGATDLRGPWYYIGYRPSLATEISTFDLHDTYVRLGGGLPLRHALVMDHNQTVIERPTLVYFEATGGCVGKELHFATDSLIGWTPEPDAWRWDWGDGSPMGEGPTASHRFTAPGTFTVVHKLMSNQGVVDDFWRHIVVEPCHLDEPAPDNADHDSDGAPDAHDPCPLDAGPQTGCPEPSASPTEPDAAGCAPGVRRPTNVEARPTAAGVFITWEGGPCDATHRYLVFNETQLVWQTLPDVWSHVDREPWLEPHRYHIQAMAQDEPDMFLPHRAVPSNVVELRACRGAADVSWCMATISTRSHPPGPTALPEVAVDASPTRASAGPLSWWPLALAGASVVAAAGLRGIDSTPPKKDPP